MIKLVQSYLTRRYDIKTSDAGNDGVYLKSDTRKNKAPYYHSKLLKELKVVFNLNDETAKLHVKVWATSQKKDVDLEFYWKESIDIVSVQPMNGPTGMLFYLNYVYDSKPKTNATKSPSEITKEPRTLKNWQDFLGIDPIW